MFIIELRYISILTVFRAVIGDGFRKDAVIGLRAKQIRKMRYIGAAAETFKQRTYIL